MIEQDDRPAHGRSQTGGTLNYAAWHAHLAGSGPKRPPAEAAVAPIDGLERRAA